MVVLRRGIGNPATQGGIDARVGNQQNRCGNNDPQLDRVVQPIEHAAFQVGFARVDRVGGHLGPFSPGSAPAGSAAVPLDLGRHTTEKLAIGCDPLKT